MSYYGYPGSHGYAVSGGMMAQQVGYMPQPTVQYAPQQTVQYVMQQPQMVAMPAAQYEVVQVPAAQYSAPAYAAPAYSAPAYAAPAYSAPAYAAPAYAAPAITSPGGGTYASPYAQMQNAQEYAPEEDFGRAASSSRVIHGGVLPPRDATPQEIEAYMQQGNMSM